MDTRKPSKEQNEKETIMSKKISACGIFWYSEPLFKGMGESTHEMGMVKQDSGLRLSKQQGERGLVEEDSWDMSRKALLAACCRSPNGEKTVLYGVDFTTSSPQRSMEVPPSLETLLWASKIREA